MLDTDTSSSTSGNAVDVVRMSLIAIGMKTGMG